MKTTLVFNNLREAMKDGYEPKIGDIFSDLKQRECELLEIIYPKEEVTITVENNVTCHIDHSIDAKWKVIETGRIFTGSLNNLYRQFTYNVEVL